MVSSAAVSEDGEIRLPSSGEGTVVMERGTSAVGDRSGLHKTFVEATVGCSSTSPIFIDEMVDGVITLDDAAVVALSGEWRYAVLAKSDNYVAFDMFVKMTRSWAAGNARVYRAGDTKCKFIINLCSMEDYNKVLSKRVVRLRNVFIRLMPYDPFSAVVTNVSVIPLWVSLLNLLPELYHETIFQRVGDGIGRLVAVDSFTKNKLQMEAATLCVEVDMKKPLLKTIEFKMKGGSVSQPISYPHLPNYCSHCNKFGHKLARCWVLHPDFRKSAGDGGMLPTAIEIERLSPPSNSQPVCGNEELTGSKEVTSASKELSSYVPKVRNAVVVCEPKGPCSRGSVEVPLKDVVVSSIQTYDSTAGKILHPLQQSNAFAVFDDLPATPDAKENDDNAVFIVGLAPLRNKGAEMATGILDKTVGDGEIAGSSSGRIMEKATNLAACDVSGDFPTAVVGG